MSSSGASLKPAPAWRVRVQAPLAALRARALRAATGTSLRARILGALLLAVFVAVVAETASHLTEVNTRLEREIEAQGARVADAIRAELDQTVSALDFEIEQATDPRGQLARTLGSGRLEARVLGTQKRLQPGSLEILKVLGPDGAILSSGSWPASFGALDPLYATYKSEPGRRLRIVDEATPAGSAPALERWGVGRAGSREVVVVAGRFLDATALERMRGRTGADLLALCTSDAAAPRTAKGLGDVSSSTARGDSAVDHVACAAASAKAPEVAATFDPSDPRTADGLYLQAVELGGTRLYVGLDRSAIDRVARAILEQALAVGLFSLAFAMLLGTLIATRILRPLENLSATASTLASGDLSARVAVGAGGGAEVDRLVAAFNQMAIDLERGQTRLVQTERVAAWQEIARGLAHELKNPLTPILGAMEVLRRARKLERADFDAILDEQSTAVIEEVMRLKELADGFARFARLPDPKLEPLVLAEVVDHAVALYAQTGGDVSVVRHVQPDMPTVPADRTQLATVVTNLVKNAVEAMDQRGTLTCTVDVENPSAPGAGSFARIIVEDTGPGIAPEVRGRLFTPYVTTKGSRGTGLGLALAHRIVVEHGGSIEAGPAAHSPTGAAFIVRLPLVRGATAATPAEPVGAARLPEA